MVKTALLKPNTTFFGFALFLVTNAFTIWGGVFPSLPYDFQTPDALMTFSILQSVAFCSTLLVAAIIAPRISSAIGKPAFIGAGVIFFAGAVILLLCTFIQTNYLLALAGIFIGCGSGGSYLFWERVFASETDENAGIHLMAASAACPVIYGLLMLLPSEMAKYSIFILIPMSLAFLYISTKRIDLHQAMFSQPAKRFDDFAKNLIKDIWRPALCVASLGFVSGIIRAITIDDPSTGFLINAISMISIAASALLLIFIWCVLKIRFDLTKFYQGIFPFVATGFLLLPVLGTGYHYFFAGFSYFIFSLVSMLMMLSCAEIARKRELSPVFVYGLFAGFVYFLSSVGSIIGGTTSAMEEFGFAQLAMIALFAVYILSLVLFTSRNKREKGATNVIVVESSRDVLCERCVELAKETKLSKREAEIMEFIVRGRDVPHIADTLVISENTVRTHSKSIYRKANVHNKQELLSLIEGIEINETS